MNQIAQHAIHDSWPGEGALSPCRTRYVVYLCVQLIHHQTRRLPRSAGGLCVHVDPCQNLQFLPARFVAKVLANSMVSVGSFYAVLGMFYYCPLLALVARWFS